MHKFTVSINTYPNQTRDVDLKRCLASVFRQTFQDFNVLIVENFENDSKLKPIIEAFSSEKYRISVVVDPKKGLANLFNQSWLNAKTEYVAYIADDAEADPSWLSAIDRELTESKNIGVVTGPTVSSCYPAGQMHALYLASQHNPFLKILAWPYLKFAMEDKILKPGNLFESGAYSIGAGLKESRNYPRQEIDLATTTNMGLKRKLVEDLGGFDGYFNYNHADGDLFIRIKKAGLKILFNPGASVIHHVRLGPSRNPYFIGMDTARFYKRRIRPKSVKGLIGACLNICILNLYFVYLALALRDARQLNGIWGFFRGALASKG